MQASHKKIRYGETVPDLFGHVMYSFAVVHESRILKQARPESQYVDLLRIHACYSLMGQNPL